MRRMKRFGRRSVGPTRTWASIMDNWVITATASSTQVKLLELQTPNSMVSLTADPPEDLTLLRIRGSFSLAMSGTGSWTMALLVQDTNWTNGGTFQDDSDKRILWSRTFETGAISSLAGFNGMSIDPPGIVTVDATVDYLLNIPGVADVDIAPKVKVEAGKALYLAAYENTGTAALSTGSRDMRVLFQRSRRR